MFECHIKKPDLFFALAGAVLFVVLGFLIVMGGLGVSEQTTELDRLFGIGLGWVCIVFFGAIGLKAIRQYYQSCSGAILSIDETGIWDRRISKQMIPWSAIRSASLFRGKTFYAAHLRFLSLQVHEAGDYQLQHRSRLFAIAERFLKRMYDEPGISISLSMLDQSAEDIMQAIVRESGGSVSVKE